MARGLSEGIQAQCMTRRPMQAWVSSSGCGTNAFDPIHTAWGAISEVSSVTPTTSTAQQHQDLLTKFLDPLRQHNFLKLHTGMICNELLQTLTSLAARVSGNVRSLSPESLRNSSE